MPNFMEMEGGKVRIRFKPEPSDDDEDVDEDDMEDDEDSDDEDDGSRSQQLRERRSYERQRWEERQRQQVQMEEAKRLQRRQMRMQSNPQVPMNPYSTPQPQYVSVEAITNLMDTRFNRIEGYLQIAVMVAVLSIISTIVLATLILAK